MVLPFPTIAERILREARKAARELPSPPVRPNPPRAA